MGPGVNRSQRLGLHFPPGSRAVFQPRTQAKWVAIFLLFRARSTYRNFRRCATLFPRPIRCGERSLVPTVVIIWRVEMGGREEGLRSLKSRNPNLEWAYERYNWFEYCWTWVVDFWHFSCKWKNFDGFWILVKFGKIFRVRRFYFFRFWYFFVELKLFPFFKGVFMGDTFFWF